MTSCKGTWISHFHYMHPELSSPSNTWSVYELSRFNVYFFTCPLVFEYLPLFWSQGRFITSCKGTWISHFHYMSQNWVFRLKLSQCTNFMFQRLFLHVSLVFEYLPLFWPQGRFMTSCKGHEFHIFTICVQNWVLRLKLSQGTNFHVSTFISWRVISLCTFSPIFGPKGDLWRHARGHEFHIFTIWVQNWVLRLKLSVRTFMVQRLYLHVSLVFEY